MGKWDNGKEVFLHHNTIDQSRQLKKMPIFHHSGIPSFQLRSEAELSSLHAIRAWAVGHVLGIGCGSVTVLFLRFNLSFSHFPSAG
jgi:hypothetical protein